MNIQEKIVTHFIESVFSLGSSWDDVSPYAHAEGTYIHPILMIPTIRELHKAIGDFRSVFPDLHQVVSGVGIVNVDHYYVKTFASATFLGNFGEIVANGRRWEVPVFWEFKLLEDKINFASELGNHHAINQQLGVNLFKAPFEQT
jgi:hypothetical protein